MPEPKEDKTPETAALAAPAVPVKPAAPIRFELVIPKEVEQKIPLLLRGPAKDMAKAATAYVNSIDVDKNGKADFEEYGPVILAVLPHVIDFAHEIDWGKALGFLVQQFAKNRNLAAVHAQNVVACVNQLPVIDVQQVVEDNMRADGRATLQRLGQA